jgi:hypothetical protein
MADLNALYEQYLGRSPDPSGISTWSGQDEASIIAGILGSQEYANNQSNQGNSGGGGGSNSTPMYQDSSGNMVEEINTPVPYDEQVATLLRMGTPENQIQGLIGTKENFNQNLKAQAQEVYERTGNLPSYAASSGFTPGPPSWLDPQHYVSEGYAAPYTKEQITGAVDPNNYRTMNGQLYASAKGPSDLSGGEYLINPNTGRFALDASGNPIGVTYPREKPGTFESIMETAIPLFIAGASIPVLGGMGAELLGTTSGGFGLTGASGANGAMGANSALQLAPSAGTIGGFGSVSAPSLATGLGVGAGGVLGAGALSPETVAIMEAMKAGTGYGLNASQVPNLAQGLELGTAGALGAGSSALSMSDILKGLSTAKSSGLTGALSQGAASGLSNSLGKLAVGQEGMGMEIPGIVRTNQNPFLQTQATPLQTPQKTELSSIASLLRQG